MKLGDKQQLFCRCTTNVSILKEKKLSVKGIYGIFPANQVNDDIEIKNGDGKVLDKF
jgi:cobalamin-dependent methionine synthase I